MSRFKEQLLELASKEPQMPGAKLVFIVPLASLRNSSDSMPPSVVGDWTVAVVQDAQLMGTVAQQTGVGAAEHGLEWLMTELRPKLQKV